MLKVISAGLWTSIQDSGRFGYRHLGVPLSGVMDTRSAGLANLLLNNSQEAAVMEISLSGPVLEFQAETRIAITGADMSPSLNDEVCSMNSAIDIQAGARLSFGRLVYGARSYIAIEQGFKTEVDMESRSFYSGITEKSKLQGGEFIDYLECTHPGEHSHAGVKINDKDFQNNILPVYPGPEFGYLTREQRTILESNAYSVSKTNNRTAYQLNEVLANELKPILTSAVLPGTVQLTPSGRLIILMRDCQTTGGYPRVLQLTEESINCLSQKKMGDIVEFHLLF